MSKKLFYFAQKGLILNKEKDSILVNKYTGSQYLPEKLNGKLCLPGGRVTDEDLSLESSFIRHIQQETGIEIIPSLPFYVWNWSYEKEGKIQNIVAVARIGIYESGELKNEPIKKSETIQDQPFWLKISDINIGQFVEDEQPAVELFLKDHILHSLGSPKNLAVL